MRRRMHPAVLLVTLAVTAGLLLPAAHAQPVDGPSDPAEIES